MSAPLKLWINRRTKILQIGPNSGGQSSLPNFHKYEVVPLCITILDPDPDNELDFERVNISDLTLKVSMNNTLDTATPFAQQLTWTKDLTQNSFTGNLDLNTGAANTYIGSNDSVTAYFAVELVEGAARSVIYQAVVTIRLALIQPTSTSPDPSQEYLLKSEALDLFTRPIFKGLQTYVSPNEQFQRIIGVDNNGTAIDQTLPYP